jgi:hypothetical protein
MNILSLDKSQPEIAEALKDCEVGVPKTLTLTVVPIADNEGAFVATVQEVAYAEEEVVEEEMVPEDDAEVPYKPRASKGSATAVEA